MHRFGALNDNSLYVARTYAWVFVGSHYLFRDVNSFPRVKLEDTVSFGEHIISKDKYTSILSGEMEATLFVTLQLVLLTCG